MTDHATAQTSLRLLEDAPLWPAPYRCAIAITFDVDVDSGLRFYHPDDAYKRTSAMSWLHYDRVAVPRLLRIFAAAGLRQTFFLPGWCVERYPETPLAIADAGQELALHGYLHESAEATSLQEEQARIAGGLAAFSEVVKQRPTGWRSPGYRFSRFTAEALAAEDFLYDSSLMGNDVPYLLETPTRPLIELPTDWTNDDWPQYVHSPDFQFEMQARSPEGAMEVFRADIEAARRHGALWISVWHPFVSGRLARADAIARLLDDLQTYGDVWIASLEEIAAHINRATADGRYHPPLERVPQQ